MGIRRVNKLQYGFRSQRNRVRISRLTRSLQLEKNTGFSAERGFPVVSFAPILWIFLERQTTIGGLCYLFGNIKLAYPFPLILLDRCCAGR